MVVVFASSSGVKLRASIRASPISRRDHQPQTTFNVLPRLSVTRQGFDEVMYVSLQRPHRNAYSYSHLAMLADSISVN